MNTAIAILISAVVGLGWAYALFSPKSILSQQVRQAPKYMVLIGVLIFLAGVALALLAAFGIIGLGGDGRHDFIIPVASLGLGGVFGLLFATNFYQNYR